MSVHFPAKLLRRRTLMLVVIVLAAAGAGASIDRIVEHRHETTHALIPADSVHAKPGPWGDLCFAPFTISAPDEALPIRSLEARGTHWMFPQKTEMDVREFLASAGIPLETRDALLRSTVEHPEWAGLELEPSFSFLTDLSNEARLKLYQFLAQFPENRGALNFIHKDTLDERFAGSGVSRQTLSIFRKLCCEHGDYLVFSGLEAMLGQLPSFEEKLRFVKALTRQKTMLFRLYVGPETDVEALADYWGKGSYATDVRTILRSVATVKGGTWIDILMVLPPLPSSQLYFYPIVADNPLDGPAVIRDCHWTSINFFRDKPDPKLEQPGYIMQTLRENYYPTPGDPAYGDLVLLTKADGTVLHSAIYLADEVVFTKNGATVIYPWMLCTVTDLLKQYTFQVPAGEQIKVSYFRNRTL